MFGCSRCNRVLPASDFAVDASKPRGIKSWCRECDNERSKRYYEANRERRLAAAKARYAPNAKPPQSCRSCGVPTPSARHWYCDRCRPARLRQRERKRNRNRSRPTHGLRYGREHKAMRKQWAPLVAAGGVRCARCGEPILPGAPWDLGHVDGEMDRWHGPEHPACNRATAGRKQKRSTSRAW